MIPRILAALVATGLMFAPIVSAEKAKKKEAGTMSEDMRRAIAFERFKDMAADRQARKEAVHPSVSYSDANRSADRMMDDSQNGRIVKDPGPTVKKDR